MRILSLRCKYTNSYLLQYGSGWIMIDTDWTDTLPQLMRLLKQNNVRIGDIKYLVVTHFHPDHAGIAQNLKELGVRLVLHERQVSGVSVINQFFEKETKVKYKKIRPDDNIIFSGAESRAFLRELGLDGELLPTPGHSDDSVSLMIDCCCAFTGDLPAYSLAAAYNDPAVSESWARIKSFRVSAIYPAHGNSYTL